MKLTDIIKSKVRRLQSWEVDGIAQEIIKHLPTRDDFRAILDDHFRKQFLYDTSTDKESMENPLVLEELLQQLVESMLAP